MSPFLIATLNTVFLLAAVSFFAKRSASYSHLRHTISELGAATSPQSRVVSLAVFVPVGLGCLAIAWLAFDGDGLSDLAKGTSALAFCLGVGYAGGGLFPCDEGSPITGSWRQSVHNLCGGIEYVGGAAALWSIGSGSDYRSMPQNRYQLAASVVGLAAIALSIPALFRWRGAIQRIAEFLLFGGLIVATWRLQAAIPPAP